MSRKMFDHDGLFERLPAPRVKAMIERWNYRGDMERLAEHHKADPKTFLAPVDRVMAFLHAGAN